MKLGLVVHTHRPSAHEFARRLVETADRLGMDVAAGPEEPVDVVVAVGGDGTVLEAVRRALSIDRPVLGFNLGTVGFLADAEVDHLEEALGALASGEYRIERRMTVGVDYGEREVVGLNDVVIEKIESQRLVVLAVEIDGEPFLTYRADGLVVATPTGSTAYAFSAGGPLVDPQVESLLITPVAPHSLFGRTLMLKPSARILVRVAADREVRVSVDGVGQASLRLDDSVTIRRGTKDALFVRFDHAGFPAKVVRKFGLGDA